VKLSVLVPVYNEEQTLEEVVRRVSAVKIPKEIVLVDDGSKDRSREILTRLRKLKQQEFMLSHHSEPLPTDLMSLREHYSPDEKDIDFVVALLVIVAFSGVLVAWLLCRHGFTVDLLAPLR